MKYEMRKCTVDEDGAITYYGKKYYNWTYHPYNKYSYSYTGNHYNRGPYFLRNNSGSPFAYMRKFEEVMVDPYNKWPQPGDTFIVSKADEKTHRIRLWLQDKETGKHTWVCNLFEYEAYMEKAIGYSVDKTELDDKIESMAYKLDEEEAKHFELIEGDHKIDTSNQDFWKIELEDTTIYFDVKKGASKTNGSIRTLGAIFADAEVGTIVYNKDTDEYKLLFAILDGHTPVRASQAKTVGHGFFFPHIWMNETKYIINHSNIL